MRSEHEARDAVIGARQRESGFLRPVLSSTWT
jgi:hypothetical protein